MAHTLLPTTTAQVSGHKFLQRRVEHGLVMGDIRMLHDPLAKRQRAFIFGTVAVVLLALGSGLLAWLRPEPHPGDAAIVRTGHGQVLVRVDDRLHPVANIASARLIAGEATDPQALGDEALHAAPRGVPLGIAGAPESLAPGGATGWAACLDPYPQQDAASGEHSARTDFKTTFGPDGDPAAEVIVLAGARPRPLGEREAVIVDTGADEWLVSARGRTRLGEDSRKSWGIPDDAPRWPAPARYVEAFVERPEHEMFPDVPEEGEGNAALSFLEPPTDGVQGDPPAGWLCADAAGEAGTVEPTADTVALPTRQSGEHTRDDAPGTSASPAVASRFGGLEDAVGVDTGAGFLVVSASGYRHDVPDAATLDILGAAGATPAPWPILALLPEGPALHTEAALRPLLE